MAKQLTAPGCKYSIVARVDTTIYSPDQKWTLDVPAGQTDFIAETNEIIIPADAMMCPKLHQIDEDTARVTLLGRGVGSLAIFVTRAIEQIVGKGNAQVTYEEGKLTVVLADSVTARQAAAVESMLQRLLPKDVVLELDEIPLGYMRAEFLETSTAGTYISTGIRQRLLAYLDYMNVQFSNLTYKGMWGIDGYYSSNKGCGWCPINNDKVSLYGTGYHKLVAKTRHQLIHVLDAYRGAPEAKSKIGLCIDGTWSAYENADTIRRETTSTYRLFSNSAKERLYSARFTDVEHKEIANYVPAIDPAGIPCMFDTITRQALRNNGTGQFIVGMTLEQVRSLSLPAGGGQLTLSLPYEASIDKLAQTALEQARENGWELTLQYAGYDVPAGYRKLDFLESTGTQWIDTGVKLTNESQLYLDCYLIGTFTNQFLIGARATFGSAGNAITFNNDNVYPQFGNHAPAFAAKPEWLESRLKINNSKDGFFINAELITTYSDSNVFETLKPSGLFAITNADGVDYRKPVARIYAAKISEGIESICDFIPCITPEGKLGMYNKVDGTLHENKGNGAFIAGLATIDDVLNLWLPETNGTLTVSVPADTPDSAVDQLRENNPTWQIAIQYRTDNEN